MSNRLVGLDALRGVAAIAVVLFHLGLPIAGAHLAVDFFFMLSGFVMARTYEDRLRSGELGGFRFFAARYRRLWGWMALGTTIGLVAALGQFGFSKNLLLTYALMLAMVPAVNLPAAPYLLNMPLWSIVYELVANLAHGLGLARMGKAALALLAGFCAIGLAWAISTAGFPRGGFPQYHWLVLFRVGSAYVLGILLYRLFGDAPPIRIPFAAAMLALPLYIGAVYLWPWQWAPMVFILILAPLMIFGGLSAVFSSATARRYAVALGAMSFPLYAVHYPVIQLLKFNWGALLLGALALAGLYLHRRRNRMAAPENPGAVAAS